MNKRLFRNFITFFIVSIVATIFILMIESVLDERNDLKNYQLVTDGLYAQLFADLQVKSASEQKKYIFDLNRNSANHIERHQIDSDIFTHREREKLRQDRLIFKSSNNLPDKADKVYRSLPGGQVVFSLNVDVNDYFRAYYYFDIAIQLIVTRLQQSLSENDTVETLAMLSQYYGYPIQLIDIKDLTLKKSLLTRLNLGKWAIDYPLKNSDAEQVIYYPYTDDKIIKLGPMQLPAEGVYRTYFIYFMIFLVSQCIALIITVRFQRSLSHLKKLADDCENNKNNLISRAAPGQLFHTIENTLIELSRRLHTMLSQQKMLTQSVSHDIRGPLSRLRLRIHSLEGENAILKEGMQHDINDIDEIIESILLYANPDKPVAGLNLIEVNIIPWLRDVLVNYDIGNNHNLALKFHSVLSECYIAVDLFLLRRAIENLLENAIRYASRKVEVDVMVTGNNLYIRIKNDNGGQIEKLTSHKSYSVGLKVVDSIVSWHQGHFDLVKNNQRETIATINLPLSNT